MLSALIAFIFTVNHERDPRSFKDLLQVSCCISRQAVVLAEHKLRDSDGCKALDICVKQGNFEGVKLLVESGADVDY